MNKPKKANVERLDLTDRIGFFGKIPSHGDFVSDGMDRDVMGKFDNWLQNGLHQLREKLPNDWSRHYEATPPVRFIIERDILGPMTYIGVLLPSRDRVGREYPLIILAQLTSYTSHPRHLYKDDTWFMAVEALAESTSKANVDVADLKASVQRLRLPRSVDIDGASTEPDVRPKTSLWWLIDPDTNKPTGVKIDSELDGEDFWQIFRQLSLLQPQNELEQPKAKVEAPTPASDVEIVEASIVLDTEYATEKTGNLRCSFATHSGTQEHHKTAAIFINKALSVYALADGYGTPRQAAAAAKRTANSFASLKGGLSPDALLQSAKAELEELNYSLHAHENDNDALVRLILAHVHGTKVDLLWSGDCRAYLLRDGTLRQISNDHLAVGLRKTFSRAIGLQATYEPESLTVDLMAEDRLLLCNMALVSCLGERAIASVLDDSNIYDCANALVQNALIEMASHSISAIVISPSAA